MNKLKWSINRFFEMYSNAWTFNLSKFSHSLGKQNMLSYKVSNVANMTWRALNKTEKIRGGGIFERSCMYMISSRWIDYYFQTSSYLKPCKVTQQSYNFLMVFLHRIFEVFFTF